MVYNTFVHNEAFHIMKNGEDIKGNFSKNTKMEIIRQTKECNPHKIECTRNFRNCSPNT